MPIAVPYIRFSDSEQSRGSSEDRQEELISQWLARHPEYTREKRRFRDLGLSGWDGEHVEAGALGELITAIETGFIPAGSVVLVEALDRFSRLKPMATLRYLEKIVEAGVDLITIEDGQRYDRTAMNDQRLMLLVMKAQAAHEYSARLSTRVIGAYAAKVKEAKAGEKIKRRNPFWLTSDGELIPKPAKIVQEAFLAFANGMPIRMIANQYDNVFGSRQSLRNMLRNPAAIGHWQRKKVIKKDGKTKYELGELIKNVFEPAIQEELFYQVQAMLDKASQQTPTTPRRFPLAGVIQCAECGTNMVLLRAGNNSVTDTVRCRKRINNPNQCTNKKTIPVPVVGWFFYETMRPFAFRAYQRTRLPENQRQRIKLEGQIDQIKQQQARLRKLVILDENDVDAQQEYQQLVNERQRLEREINQLPTVTEEQTVSMKEFQTFLNSNPFVITNLLQQDGYRILCDNEGILKVNQSTDSSPTEEAKYIGYHRKTKLWEIQTSDGNTVFIDKYAN